MNKNAINELITNRADKNTYYNISDLNRVETVVKAIAEFMTLKGYVVNIKNKITGEWTIEDFPTNVEMARYLNNLVKIRNQLNKRFLALPESMMMLDYKGANDIERMLMEVDKVLMSIITTYRRTGATISGDGQYIDDSDLSPYLDIFGTLTWREIAPEIEDGILDLQYAVFNNGILQDL